jgi:hypothetical protein
VPFAAAEPRLVFMNHQDELGIHYEDQRTKWLNERGGFEACKKARQSDDSFRRALGPIAIFRAGVPVRFSRQAGGAVFPVKAWLLLASTISRPLRLWMLFGAEPLPP